MDSADARSADGTRAGEVEKGGRTRGIFWSFGKRLKVSCTSHPFTLDSIGQALKRGLVISTNLVVIGSRDAQVTDY